ncbi:hypothetical protein Q8F55_004094 [Vanrija albida]|uniref:Uncharacterized protein n=1 Tax=Vanrija albida TaxID=181172 RepID=A0ABR3Q628_9TREE
MSHPETTSSKRPRSSSPTPRKAKKAKKEKIGELPHLHTGAPHPPSAEADPDVRNKYDEWQTAILARDRAQTVLDSRTQFKDHAWQHLQHITESVAEATTAKRLAAAEAANFLKEANSSITAAQDKLNEAVTAWGTHHAAYSEPCRRWQKATADVNKAEQVLQTKTELLRTPGGSGHNVAVAFEEWCAASTASKAAKAALENAVKALLPLWNNVSRASEVLNETKAAKEAVVNGTKGTGAAVNDKLAAADASLAELRQVRTAVEKAKDQAVIFWEQGLVALQQANERVADTERAYVTEIERTAIADAIAAEAAKTTLPFTLRKPSYLLRQSAASPAASPANVAALTPPALNQPPAAHSSQHPHATARHDHPAGPSSRKSGKRRAEASGQAVPIYYAEEQPFAFVHPSLLPSAPSSAVPVQSTSQSAYAASPAYHETAIAPVGLPGFGRPPVPHPQSTGGWVGNAPAMTQWGLDSHSSSPSPRPVGPEPQPVGLIDHRRRDKGKRRADAPVVEGSSAATGRQQVPFVPPALSPSPAAPAEHGVLAQRTQLTPIPTSTESPRRSGWGAPWRPPVAAAAASPAPSPAPQSPATPAKARSKQRPLAPKPQLHPSAQSVGQRLRRPIGDDPRTPPAPTQAPPPGFHAPQAPPRGVGTTEKESAQPGPPAPGPKAAWKETMEVNPSPVPAPQPSRPSKRKHQQALGKAAGAQEFQFAVPELPPPRPTPGAANLPPGLQVPFPHPGQPPQAAPSQWEHTHPLLPQQQPPGAWAPQHAGNAPAPHAPPQWPFGTSTQPPSTWNAGPIPHPPSSTTLPPGPRAPRKASSPGAPHAHCPEQRQQPFPPPPLPATPPAPTQQGVASPPPPQPEPPSTGKPRRRRIPKEPAPNPPAPWLTYSAPPPVPSAAETAAKYRALAEQQRYAPPPWQTVADPNAHFREHLAPSESASYPSVPPPRTLSPIAPTSSERKVILGLRSVCPSEQEDALGHSAHSGYSHGPAAPQGWGYGPTAPGSHGYLGARHGGPSLPEPYGPHAPHPASSEVAGPAPQLQDAELTTGSHAYQFIHTDMDAIANLPSPPRKRRKGERGRNAGW